MGLWWLKMQNFLSSLALLAHTNYFFLFCQRLQSQAVNNSFNKGVNVVRIVHFCGNLISTLKPLFSFRKCDKIPGNFRVHFRKFIFEFVETPIPRIMFDKLWSESVPMELFFDSWYALVIWTTWPTFEEAELSLTLSSLPLTNCVLPTGVLCSAWLIDRPCSGAGLCCGRYSQNLFESLESLLLQTWFPNFI